jgi:hypothetical protein
MPSLQIYRVSEPPTGSGEPDLAQKFYVYRAKGGNGQARVALGGPGGLATIRGPRAAVRRGAVSTMSRPGEMRPIGPAQPL